jgi:hypothetical protein
MPTTYIFHNKMCKPQLSCLLFDTLPFPPNLLYSYCNLNISNSPTTDLIAPTLQRLLMFQVPNLTSFFHCFSHAKESVQVRGTLKHFITIKIFYGEGLLVPRPTNKLEDHPLSAVRDSLFNIFAATLDNWRTSLHPQPEDTPCHGDG